MKLIPFSRFVPVLVAGAFLTPVAHAQYLLTPPPQTPARLAPAAGTHRGTVGNTRPTFTFGHGGTQSTSFSPTTHFMICVYATGGSCAWPGTWNATAGSLPRTPAGPPSRYNYTFVPPTILSNALLDRDLQWNVGACNFNVKHQTVACTLGKSAAAVYFSTRNLDATDVSIDRMSTGMGGWVRADLLVENTGSSASGSFNSHIRLYQVLTAGMVCVTDPTAAGVLPNDWAILGDGTEVQVSDIPANALIVGIRRSNMWFSQTDLMPSNGLEPGAELSVGFTEHSFTWNPMETERGFVGGGYADITRVVREFAENDNVRFECRMVLR